MKPSVNIDDIQITVDGVMHRYETNTWGGVTQHTIKRNGITIMVETDVSGQVFREWVLSEIALLLTGKMDV